MAKRVWTPQTVQAWRTERDERRKAKGQPALGGLSSAAKEKQLESEKHEVIEAEVSRLTTQAWVLGKYPFVSHPAPFAAILVLPKNYHARGGTDKLRVRKGDDLNAIVYKYYEESVDSKTYPGENYVSNDGICPRRHEYMGPSPHIASYRFTEAQIEIEWWEEYIKDTWIGTRRWKVEVEFDKAVEGWFVKDRNDY